MSIENGFVFPGKKNLETIRTAYAALNGQDSFVPPQQWQSDTWSAEAHCSRGALLEKAGIGMVNLAGGTVDGVPAEITLLQSMAYPADPCLPGCIIMASTSRMEGQDVIMMVYVDLIDQNARLRQQDKDTFTAALAEACSRDGRSIEEYQAFMTGRGMLGGCAAECGMLYFFEEGDAPFLEASIAAVLETYGKILGSAPAAATADDRDAAAQRRQQMVAWILEEDYGTKVARENGIAPEVMQMYAFPPAQDSGS